jgi:hypothetical protein
VKSASGRLFRGDHDDSLTKDDCHAGLPTAVQQGDHPASKVGIDIDGPLSIGLDLLVMASTSWPTASQDQGERPAGGEHPTASGVITPCPRPAELAGLDPGEDRQGCLVSPSRRHIYGPPLNVFTPLETIPLALLFALVALAMPSLMA